MHKYRLEVEDSVWIQILVVRPQHEAVFEVRRTQKWQFFSSIFFDKDWAPQSANCVFYFASLHNNIHYLRGILLDPRFKGEKVSTLPRLDVFAGLQTSWNKLLVSQIWCGQTTTEDVSCSGLDRIACCMITNFLITFKIFTFRTDFARGNLSHCD